MRRLRHFLRDLAGRNDQRFVELLGDQLACAIDATELLHEAVRDGRFDAALQAGVVELEERADRSRDALIEELGTVLSTPVDREDLFRLSRSVDDVVDNLRDFVDALALFDVEDASACTDPLEVLERGLRGLVNAVQLLADAPEQVPEAARASKRATRVRQAYLHGLVTIFETDDPVEMLKQRELLRRLDVVGLRFGEAADVLADAALKRG